VLNVRVCILHTSGHCHIHVDQPIKLQYSNQIKLYLYSGLRLLSLFVTFIKFSVTVVKRQAYLNHHLNPLTGKTSEHALPMTATDRHRCCSYEKGTSQYTSSDCSSLSTSCHCFRWTVLRHVAFDVILGDVNFWTGYISRFIKRNMPQSKLYRITCLKVEHIF
jgi:hypothetical protein